MQVNRRKQLKFQKPPGSENRGMKTEGITDQSSAEAGLLLLFHAVHLNTQNSTAHDPAAAETVQHPLKTKEEFSTERWQL